MKYTKMVCTIGPASDSFEMLQRLIEAGMDVARLNFSHGSHKSHQQLMHKIADASRTCGKAVAILQDLQGPKIRMGVLSEPYRAVIGKEIVLGKGGLPVQINLSEIVKVGQTVLVDDGFIELRVTKVLPHSLHCLVIHGGQILSNKGINVPESNTDFSVFTKKDRNDLAFGLKNNVDLVAMSFVRTAEDIREVKRFISSRLKNSKNRAPWVIAKIEKPQAIKNIDEIIEASDGIMVARGDLGIEAEQERVPLFQKMIIQKCRAARKPVIVATQMLESMVKSPRPTRAEVSDVANAVIDHADATMLSGESAYGQYPLEAVKVMVKTIQVTEQGYFEYVLVNKNFHKDSPLNKILLHAKKTGQPLVVFSATGELVRNLSNLRQNVPIFAFAPREVCNRLALVWGVLAFPAENFTLKNMEQRMLAELAERGLLTAESTPGIVIGKLIKGKESLFSAKIHDKISLKKLSKNVRM